MHLFFYDRNNSTLEQRIITLSLNHQILSPYTAFVGVETTGPKVNNTNSKVRHIPIQISKGDEHLSDIQPLYGYSAYGGGFAGGFYGAPMAMAAMPSHGFSRGHGGSGFGVHSRPLYGP